MVDDIRLDSNQVASIIRSQFPGFANPAVAHLGEGCDSIAFEIDEQWVFRFPKREEVDQQLAMECRILPILAKEAPLLLPDFRFNGQPSEAFPFHFVGYRKIPGVPAIQVAALTLPLEKWAPTIGEFLTWLHTSPVEDALRLGVPMQDMQTLIDEVRTDALADFHLLEHVGGDSLPELRIYLERGCVASEPTSRALVHADLAAEHFLCDPVQQTLTGVIDWTEIAVGDISQDVAGVYHWGGPEFVERVSAHYIGNIDESVLSRARYLAACRGVADIAFGLAGAGPEYIEAGKRALAFCLVH